MKFIQNKGELALITKKYIQRLFPPLIFWLTINILLQSKEYLGFRLDDILKLAQMILFYPLGALWFVLACIGGIFLLSFFLKKQKLNQAIAIGILLYSFALICNSYFFFVEKTFLSILIREYMNIFLSARNGLFVGMLFLSLGVYLSKRILENQISIRKTFYVFIVSALGFILELIFLKNKNFLDDHALYISFITLIPSLFIILSSIKLKNKTNSKLIRDYSVSIYFLHRPVLFLVDKYLPFRERFMVFIVVLVVSGAISSIVFSLNNKFLNKVFR